MNLKFLFLKVLLVSIAVCAVVTFIIFLNSDQNDSGSHLISSNQPASSERSENIDATSKNPGLTNAAMRLSSESVNTVSSYQSVQDIGALSLKDMTIMYGFDRLTVTHDKLDLNHNTRSIIENFVDTVPKDSLLHQMPRIEESLRTRFGSQPAKDAVRVIRSFLDFRDSVRTMDDDMNKRGVTRDQFSRSDMMKTRSQLQDKAFGSYDANLLFTIERQAYTIMERQMQELKSPQNLSPAQIEKLNAEYTALLTKK